MGVLFAHIVSYFNRHVWVWLLIVVGLSAVFYGGFRRLEIDENIYSVFPQGESFNSFNRIVKENKLNKQIIFSISAEGKESEQILAELDSTAAAIKEKCKNLVSDLETAQESKEELVLEYNYSHLHCFLDTADYSQIAARLGKDSIALSIANVNDRMASANGFFMGKVFRQDPLGLGWRQLQKFNPRQDSSGMRVEDGILYSADGKRALFTAVLGFELDDNLQNEKLNDLLSSLKKEINGNQDLEFDYFGTFQIAYENARQVKEDTFLTMIISIGLILLLLVVYYRSVLVPLYFVLPALFAGFGGMGLVGYIHPQISAISIATSAVLMGIVLDYAFHFFTHLKHSGDLIKTVRDLSAPMLVGSFTTVAAFTALIFTDSVILQNFGWISLCTLATAALFTLLLLPTLLFLTRFGARKKKEIEWKFKMPKWTLRMSMYGILILTGVLLYNANSFSFDADLNNLSYHTDELAEKEEYFTGIDPRTEKKLHVFITGTDKQQVIEQNFRLYQNIDAFRAKNGLEELVSVAPYEIPSTVNERKTEQWNAFWQTHKDSTLDYMQSVAAEYDFSEVAFHPFSEWISGEGLVQVGEPSLVKDLGLDRFLYKDARGWTAITSIVVDRSDLAALKAQIQEVEGAYIFDVAEMTNLLLETVQKDFNYLLIFSSLLVFFSLLVVYGRFELALFAMLPMVISWVWILGIAGLFGIEFNFVNIIVATFIFGLGDDFSIFVTDGLQQKYKSNSNNLVAYRSAIVLSGLTTIIGTGVLYFAKHPAIHSIAFISVVGISCIMLVTLLLQPAIYRFFITNRTSKGRSPVTLLGLFYSNVLFVYFFVGCTMLNVLLLPFLLIPVSKEKKRRVLNYMVSKLAKSTIYLGFHVRKKILHKERLDFTRPSIIIANHSSFLDILLMIMIDPKVIIMVKKWVYYSPVFGFFIRYSGYLFIAEGTEYNLDLIKNRVENGYSVMIFPEGTRSRDGKIKRFHKGAFYLAQELKLDIQPILIIGAHYVNPKNDFIIKSGSLILKVLPRIRTEDEAFQQRFGLLTHYVQDNMRSELTKAKHEIENAAYLRNRVQYNYLYKGPVLEWYVRIKWRFEEKNYELYDTLLGDRKRILDIGCGYGYLSYFLHYRNEERSITGFDYDEDKIAVAANGYDKTEQLNFESGDVRTQDFSNSDAIFFNDVLHYLKREDQFEVLDRAAKQLNPGGLLIVRDGITDLEERHKKTQRTERYSTKILSFNQVSEELSFFSSQDIFNFAEAHGMHCEMQEQSERTSNVLFIIRRGENE